MAQAPTPGRRDGASTDASTHTPSTVSRDAEKLATNKFINAMNLDGTGRYEDGWHGKLRGVSLREDFKKSLSMRLSMREAEAERDRRSDSSDTSTEAALKFWQYVEDGSLGCERSASDSGTCPSCPVGDGDDGSEAVGSSEAPG